MTNLNLHNFFFAICSFIVSFCFCQTKNEISDVLLNPSNVLVISPTVYNINDTSSKEIIKLLERYFITKDSSITIYNDWTNITMARYNMPDYMLRSSLTYFKNYKIIPNLISIEEGKKIWRAKVAFNAFDKIGFKGVVCVYNFGVRKEGGLFKLFNIFDEADLTIIKVEGCDFYVDNESNSDTTNLYKMLSFNNKMFNFFGKKKTFKYINVKDSKKLNNLIGFDFEMFMYIPTEISAFTDIVNETIYASNNSFYYPHELVHLYINDLYSNTCHSWFDEGLATYWGGSMGLTLEEHLSRLNIFLKNNQKINLNNLLDFIRMDEKTSYKYTIGGLLCKLIYLKEGDKGIIKLLKSGKANEDFYKCIEINFGVDRFSLNNFIRKELNKY